MSEVLTIEERIKKVVAEHLYLSVDDIRNDADIHDDLGADSLDAVEMLMAIEDEFRLEIPDEEADKIVTVQQAIDYVTANVKA